MTMKAAVSKVDITPPIGVELCGYGFYLKRRATGIKNPLFSKAIVISNDYEKIAIVANDIIGITRDLTTTVRSLIKKETGIPEDHIMITCTHTHHGPATLPLRGCGEIDEDYLKVLPKYIAGTVIKANSNLKDVKIGADKGHNDKISMNRTDKDGPIDPELGVIRVDEKDGEPLALLVNFACHATTMPIGNTLLSSDYPGIVTSFIEKVKKGSVAMFLQGACGDINPILTKTGMIEQVGESLATEALKTSKNMKVSKEAAITSKIKSLKLPLRVLSSQELKAIINEYNPKISSANEFERGLGKVFCDWAYSLQKKLDIGTESWLEIEIQAMRIGDIILVAQPAEMFVEFGLGVKANSAYRNTFVVGYANDCIGYIPDEEDYKRGTGLNSLSGYAANMAPALWDNFPFMSDAGKLLKDALINLIHSLP
jgi:hypothetical protein